jgi:hypothetical protein
VLRVGYGVCAWARVGYTVIIRAAYTAVYVPVMAVGALCCGGVPIFHVGSCALTVSGDDDVPTATGDLVKAPSVTRGGVSAGCVVHSGSINFSLRRSR